MITLFEVRPAVEATRRVRAEKSLGARIIRNFVWQGYMNENAAGPGHGWDAEAVLRGQAAKKTATRDGQRYRVKLGVSTCAV